jgi:hypothetical protein
MPIVATVITTIVIRTGPSIIESNPDWSTTEFPTVEFLDCTISIFSRQILKNSLAWNVTIDIGEGNTADIPSKVFQILPACITGNSRDNQANTNGPARAWSPVPSIVMNFTTWSAFFRKLDNNVDAHERFSIEIVHSVFGILCIFKFYKPKASHNTAVNDTAVAVEEFRDIFRASVGG